MTCNECNGEKKTLLEWRGGGSIHDLMRGLFTVPYTLYNSCPNAERLALLSGFPPASSDWPKWKAPMLVCHTPNPSAHTRTPTVCKHWPAWLLATVPCGSISFDLCRLSPAYSNSLQGYPMPCLRQGHISSRLWRNAVLRLYVQYLCLTLVDIEMCDLVVLYLVVYHTAKFRMYCIASDMTECIQTQRVPQTIFHTSNIQWYSILHSIQSDLQEQFGLRALLKSTSTDSSPKGFKQDHFGLLAQPD